MNLLEHRSANVCVWAIQKDEQTLELAPLITIGHKYPHKRGDQHETNRQHVVECLSNLTHYAALVKRCSARIPDGNCSPDSPTSHPSDR